MEHSTQQKSFSGDWQFLQFRPEVHEKKQSFRQQMRGQPVLLSCNQSLPQS